MCLNSAILPCQIPSAYFLSDVFLYLDGLFNRRLLIPDTTQQQSKISLAGEEAVKAKRCLQSLRFLWRNTQSASHSPSVQAMKDCLCPSPLQDQRAAGNRAPDAQGSSSDEEDDGDMDEPSSDDEAPSVPGDALVAASQDAVSEVGSDVGGDHVEEAPAPAPVDDDVDSLAATTLRLGASQDIPDPESPHGSEPPHSPGHDSSSDSDPPDSQLGNNWLSSFYKKYGRFGKTEKSYPHGVPRSIQDGDKNRMVEEIRESLIFESRTIDQHLYLTILTKHNKTMCLIINRCTHTHDFD